MANFDSGVSSYIIGKAEIEVGFPVDFKGRADVRCRQCYYFKANYSRCGLNNYICEYPDQYVGSHCPLNFEKEENE